jgi:hypothetical protein
MPAALRPFSPCPSSTLTGLPSILLDKPQSGMPARLFVCLLACLRVACMLACFRAWPALAYCRAGGPASCLVVCTLAVLPATAYLPACLSARLPACRPACLSCMRAPMLAGLRVGMPTSQRACCQRTLNACVALCLCTCLSACMRGRARDARVAITSRRSTCLFVCRTSSQTQLRHALLRV